MRTVALATIASLAFLIIADSPAGAQIPWQKNLRAAHTKAEAEGKLMLLHFYSDNCVYCDRLDAGAFQAPSVGQAISENFVAVKVHANSAPELAKMFKVTKFPTDIVVTPGGKKIVHRVSPQDPKKYVAMLVGTLPSMPAKNTAIAAAPPVKQSTQPNSQLAGYRNDEPAFDMPIQENVPVASEASAESGATGSSGEPELAMEGFCAVTVISEDKWIEGKPEHGVIHLGKLYMFQNADAMNTFLADPVPYTPVLNEIDVVRFFEERVIVAGKREWGVKDPTFQRMFFFADEAAMNHFIEEHHRYTDAAIEVMEKAVKDANPES